LKKYCSLCHNELDKRNNRGFCKECILSNKELNPNYNNGCKITGINNPNFSIKWTKEQKLKQSIITKMAMNKIEVRQKMRKNHTDFSGDKNPMYGIHRLGKVAPCWIDGRSFAPYPLEFNDALKESIRKRDNFTCQNCGIKERVYYRKLDVHHIDYNKCNCKKSNLITLCFECNIKANYNRKYWQEFYQEKIRCLIN
jgi:hypothetical protein